MFGFLPAPCSTCHSSDGLSSTYQQFFCGLSSRLAAEYGPSARLFTNRDGVFFSILAASQQGKEPESTFRTCCNPFGKKRDLFDNGNHASYAAAVSICGVATKLRDDADDESGLRRYASAVGVGVLRRKVSKAKQLLSSIAFPTEKIEKELLNQQQYEAEFNGDWTIVAQPTASAFGAIFSHANRLMMPSASDKNRYLENSGRDLGRIIYLLDAYEDRAEDESKKRFNPLLDKSDQQAQLWFEREYELLKDDFSKVETRQYQSLLNSILIDGVLSKGELVLGMSNRSSVSGRPKSQFKKKKDSCWDQCCDFTCCHLSDISCFSNCCDDCDCDCCSCDCGG